MNKSAVTRKTTFPMRLILYIAAGLVLIAGGQLFIYPEQTDIYFAWTIKPFITATFLGASYWSSVLIELLAAREKVWVRARISVIPVFTFTTLTLIVTLMHLDKFHLDTTAFQPMTVAATWAWIAIYALVPVLLLAIFIYQVRQPGVDEPRQSPMPIWLATTFGIQGVFMFCLGVLLFFAKEFFPSAYSDMSNIQLLPIWSWVLSPLTAQAIGAWLIGLGLTSAWAAYEHDYARSRIMAISAILFCVLQFISIARYSDLVTWDVRGFGLVIFLLFILMTNSYAWYANRKYN